MARRRSNASWGLGIEIWVLIAIFCVGLWNWAKIHWQQIALVAAGLFVLALVINAIKCSVHNRKVESLRKSLIEKYKDEEIVQLIMESSYWKGQTEEQLLDSLGEPHKIDSQVMKTKTKEIWKYGHRHGQVYRLKITLEKGKVVGWEDKS